MQVEQYALGEEQLLRTGRAAVDSPGDEGGPKTAPQKR